MIAAVPILLFDLAIGDGGLIEAGQTGQWEWGTPTMGPVGQGDCWATSLAGPYLHDTIDTIEVPLPSLGGLTRPIVVVRHYYDIAAGDLGVVEVDSGTGFVTLAPVQGYPVPGGISGTSAGYEELAFDLSGMGADPRFRLSFQSDAAVAASGWFIQQIILWDGDVVPPVVSPFLVPDDTQDVDGPYPVQMMVTDDVGLASVVLTYTPEGAPPTSVAMVDQGGGLWSAEIDGQPPNTVVEFVVEADDGSQVGVWPELGEQSFRVFLAAPTGLSGPEGMRSVATNAELNWTAPISPHPVVHYEVSQEGVPNLVVVTSESVTVSLLPDAIQQFAVRARYDVGLGDTSEPLLLDIEVPELLDLDPAAAYQGDHLYVRLSGQSLYLLQDQSTVDLGPGVDILDIDVRDANAATVLFEIAPDADEGLRDITVGSSVGPIVFRERFTVQPGAEAPGIQSIVPDALRQGDDLEIEVRASRPFAGDVTIDGGEDLVVTGMVETTGDTVRFGLAANTRARIGAHTLILDDGERLWTVDIQVDERVFASQQGCATSPGTVPSIALLLLAGLTRRRGVNSRSTCRHRPGGGTVVLSAVARVVGLGVDPR